jgi:hypothetical protein
MESDTSEQETTLPPEAVQEKTIASQSTQSEAIEPSRPSSGVSDNVDGDINQKLDMILSRIEKIELELSDVKEQNAPDFQAMNENIRTLEQKVASLSQNKPSPPKIVTPKSSSPVTTAPSRPKPQVTRPPQWELKAAQPGKAWVSLKGKNDIRPVMVGEELSGIGRIRSISFDGSRWVIEGASGRIFQ